MKRKLTIVLAMMIVVLGVARASHDVARAATSPTLAEVERETESDDGRDGNIGIDNTPSIVNDESSAGQVPIQPSTTTVPSASISAPAPDMSTTTSTPSVNVPATTPLPTVSTAFPWAWIGTRVMGIASFILLGWLSITGMLLTTGILFRFMSPATAWSIHRAIGSVLLFSVLGHVISLLLDTFIKLRFTEIFIPFASHYRPTLLALGTIGFYLLLLILATSLYTLTSHAKFWRTIHFFAFPMFVLLFLHGLLLGTDSKQWWMMAIYWANGIAVGFVVLYRMWWKYALRKAPSRQPLENRSGRR